MIIASSALWANSKPFYHVIKTLSLSSVLCRAMKTIQICIESGIYIYMHCDMSFMLTVGLSCM